MHVQAVFSHPAPCSSPLCLSTCFYLSQLCHPGPAAAGVLHPALPCLHRISSCVPNVPVSHICLETPRAAAEQFPQQSSKLSYFFLIHPKAKKSLPANSFWPRCRRQRSRGCTPNPFSWKVLCCCLFWKRRCNWFLCSVFWCHQFPGMRSWPCACKWKISIIFSEMGSSSKFPLWTELLSNVLLCVQDGIWLRWK